jgi:Nickel responsive protein SCO4226-like
MVERTSTDQYVVECFWPGVVEADVRALDARAASSTAELTAAGEPIRYLGSLLVREDETVFCLFHGPEQTVRRAAERAEIPFERILEATRSPWPFTETA